MAERTLAFGRCGVRGAPAVLLLHPLATHRHIWAPLVPVLSASYELWLPDLPGHGESPVIESRGLGGFADALLAMMDRARIEKAALVGVSLGGMVAQAAALAAPARVRSLVLAHTSARSTPAAREAWAQRLSAASAAGMASQVDSTLARWFTEPFRASAPLTMAWIAQMIRSTSLSGYGAAVAAIQGLDYLQRLAQLSCPTLVLAGDVDAAVTVEQSRALAAAIPNATLEVLSGAPHVSHVEQPTVFLERVGRFLQQTV